MQKVASSNPPPYLESEGTCDVPSDFSFREYENIRGRNAAPKELRHGALISNACTHHPLQDDIVRHIVCTSLR
jgi:hypothetical protein